MTKPLRQLIYDVVDQLEVEIASCKVLARREIDPATKASILGEKTGLMIARDMIHRELKDWDEERHK